MPFKRIIPLVLACIPTIASASFMDVSENHPYVDAINFVQQENIVQGYDGNIFRPNTTITRAEFTKIMVETLKKIEPANDMLSGEECLQYVEIVSKDSETVQFTDVDYSDWYGEYICLGVMYDIIQGDPSGTMRPHDPVNTAEAITMIHRTFKNQLQIPLLVQSQIQKAIDKYPEPHPWYLESLSALALFGIIPQSVMDNSIAQEDLTYNITRGEMADMMYKILKSKYE